MMLIGGLVSMMAVSTSRSFSMAKKSAKPKPFMAMKVLQAELSLHLMEISGKPLLAILPATHLLLLRKETKSTLPLSMI